MGEKKRKRQAEDAEVAAQPKRGRVSEPALEDAPAPANTIFSTKKSGVSRQEKSERRSKKAKKDGNSIAGAELPAPPGKDPLINGSDFVPLEDGPTATERSKKSKTPKTSSKPAVTEAEADAPAGTISKKGDRFICFVGNLPYNATIEQLKSHFVKIADGIKSIRLGTDKKTSKGKGYAFLEFSGFDMMKTCLKLYHHSIFDPSVHKEDKEAKPGQKETGKGRRINVELTAGGGGAGKQRKEKIHAKNRKLDEERERIRLKEKEEAAQEGKKEKKKTTTTTTTTGANGVLPVKKEGSEDRKDIHPSRLNRVAR